MEVIVSIATELLGGAQKCLLSALKPVPYYKIALTQLQSYPNIPPPGHAALLQLINIHSHPDTDNLGTFLRGLAFTLPSFSQKEVHSLCVLHSERFEPMD